MSIYRQLVLVLLAFHFSSALGLSHGRSQQPMASVQEGQAPEINFKAVAESLYEASFVATRAIVEHDKPEMDGGYQLSPEALQELWKIWLSEVPAYSNLFQAMNAKRPRAGFNRDEVDYFTRGLSDLFDDAMSLPVVPNGSEDREIEPLVNALNGDQDAGNYLQAIVATYNYGADRRHAELVQLSSLVLKAFMRTTRFNALTRLGGAYSGLSKTDEGGGINTLLYIRLTDRYVRYQEAATRSTGDSGTTMNLAKQLDSVARKLKQLPITPMIRTGTDTGEKTQVFGASYEITW